MRLLPLACLALFSFPLPRRRVLESIDTTGFSPAQKKILVTMLEMENCTCGCNWTIADCRNDDPKCGVSRELLNLVIKDLKAGMTEKVIVADLKVHRRLPPCWMNRSRSIFRGIRSWPGDRVSPSSSSPISSALLRGRGGAGPIDSGEVSQGCAPDLQTVSSGRSFAGLSRRSGCRGCSRAGKILADAR